MSPGLRMARPADCVALTDVCLRSKQSNGYDDAFMKACQDELTVDGATLERCDVWLAEQGGEICGFITLGPKDPVGRAVVSLFFIAPEFQRQGVGRMLWDQLLKVAMKRGVKSLVLDADPAAEGFYQRLGFVVVGRRPSGSIAGRFLPHMEYRL